jgi:hypothetical protein
MGSCKLSPCCEPTTDERSAGNLHATFCGSRDGRPPRPPSACVKKTRNRHAVRKMKEGPSESLCRERLQTAISCFSQKLRWRTLWLKGVTMITSCMDERDECKRTSENASKSNSNDIKTGMSRLFREQHGRGPTYWPCDVRCIGGVTLIRAFVRNLRTWSVMLREKAQAEAPRG